PNSVWEPTFAKLCFASRRETEFRGGAFPNGVWERDATKGNPRLALRAPKGYCVRPGPAAQCLQPQPSPVLFFSNSASNTPLPFVATYSPGNTPAMISVCALSFAPRRTVRT